MRLLSKLAAIAMITLAAVSASHAQDVNPLLPTTGTREIELRGTLQFEPNDFYSIQAGYGPFLNPNFQVKGVLGFAGGDGPDTWSLGAEANYHFPGETPLLPFVGAFLGYADTSGAFGGDVFTYGIQGGIKYFINSGTAFTAALVYRDFDEDEVEEQLAINFGLAIYLR